MKRTKQILSVFLALLMIATIIPMSSITASATQSVAGNFYRNYTLTGNGADDIVAVAQAQAGRSQASLGYTEAWCADFVSDCARLAGLEHLIPFNGGVAYLRNAMLNAGGTIVSSRQKGDIVFYYCNYCGGWCHVGIVLDGTYSLEGNVNGQVYTVGGNNGNYVDASGHGLNSGVTREYIRPNYITYTEKPTNLKVSANHTSVAVGETVTFTFSADYAEELWFGLHDENGFIYGDRFYTNSTTYTFDKAGEYRANIEAKNNIGSIQSEYIYINVYDSVPSDCKISVDNDAINVGEEVIFNLSSKNANSHWIGIHKEDDTLVYESEAGNFIKYTFNEPGIYYADFDAINGYGTTRSNKVWFTVGKYEIIYNSNGGENAPDSQSKKYNENITISSTKPTRDGYTFLGWSTNKNAPVAEYSAGSIYSKNEDVILYAVWQKNPVTVSSISIATKPTKTEYYVGDTFDSSGLTIKTTMSDGLTQTLTSGFTVSSPDMSTAGTKTITVTYSGKTASFTINVKEMPVTPDIPDTNFTINIKQPSRTTIRHNDGIILHANVDGELPENTSVVWYISNDNFDAGYLDDGMSCVFVSKNNGYTTIYAVIEDSDGNELAIDSVELHSKAGFFDKIGGFFRSLFGSTKIYEN